jgi:hypothetical protein
VVSEKLIQKAETPKAETKKGRKGTADKELT